MPPSPQNQPQHGIFPESPPGRRVVRVPPELFEAAASRLVSADAGNAVQAGKRFVQAAPAHGIDLSLMWGTIETSPNADSYIRQVCLAVLGAGRTAVLFLSGPASKGPRRSEGPEDVRDRAQCVVEACAGLARERSGLVRVVQSLPEPRELWAIRALEAGGFQRVGDLAYLRRPLPRRRAAAPADQRWPAGVVVRPVQSMARDHPDRALLSEALDRTYADTLDCPGLCGMRETQDVIDSHLSTGQFDPSLWWLVLWEGGAHGCALFNPCPEQNSVELVYLGLSPALRGRGIARSLLGHGLSHLGGPGQLSVTCAVDRQNTPALAVYRQAGFGEFSGRIAYVRAIP